MMSSRRVILAGTARKGRADLGGGVRGLGDCASGSRQEESGMALGHPVLGGRWSPER